MRKSSRRSLQRRPPRAIGPSRRWTPSTRGEHTQISNIGRGAGRSGTSEESNLNASTGRRPAGSSAGPDRRWCAPWRRSARGTARSVRSSSRLGTASSASTSARAPLRACDRPAAASTSAGSKRLANRSTNRGADRRHGGTASTRCTAGRTGSRSGAGSGRRPGAPRPGGRVRPASSTSRLSASTSTVPANGGDERALQLGAHRVAERRSSSGPSPATTTPTSCRRSGSPSPRSKLNERSSRARKPSWASSGRRSASASGAPRW